LQRIARQVSSKLGRDGRVVRLLRPVYERLLDMVTGGRGYAREINGVDRVYVNPRYRGYYPEVYEPEVYGFLRQSVVEGTVCLNVGAHVGIYAVALARWSGLHGHVYAFEPNADTAAVLEDYIARNRLQSRITVVRAAAAAVSGEAAFRAVGIEGFSRLDGPHPERPDQPGQEVSVPTLALDDFCRDRNAAPDWIVMDIEGYEIAALRGARAQFRERPGRLQAVVEVHPSLWSLSGESRATMEALLDELGLAYRGLTGQRDPLAVHGVIHLTPR
jgi:FkbM family methyltransferase